jgi:hypothetical protein
MIHEYAVEPEVLSRWQNFRYFSENFGVSRGRLISEFPKEWVKRVYESLEGCKDIEKSTIIQRLKHLKETALLPRRYQGHDWNNGAWIDNAVTEHLKTSFRAIIAVANPKSFDFVRCGDDLDETDPLWRAETECRIERTATQMAECAATLLRASSKIRFVDPYFEPNDPRFTNPLKEFLRRALTDRGKAGLRNIEYHTSNRATRAHILNAAARNWAWFRGLLPRGLRLQIVQWHKDDMHNRFILTERGGMKFANGLDEGDNPRHDVVNLLGEKVCEEISKDYDVVESKLRLVDNWEIEELV